MLEPLTDAGRGARPDRATPRAPGGQRPAPPADPPRRPGRPTRRRRRHRRVRGRHAGPGLPRPRVGPGRAGRGRRRRPLRRHPVAARRPRPGRAPASACREEKVRLTLAGVGGAFGGREDLSMQVHACLLALRTGRPVKMVYSREESFFGHVHRHPAWMRYEHGADPRRQAGLRQGAGSCSTAAPTPPPRRPSSATPPRFGVGPVRRAERRDRRATASTPTTRRAARCAASARCRPASPTRPRWTSSPPRSGMDPVELRRRNAMAQGSTLPTGQVVDCAGAGRRAARARARRCRCRRPTARRATCASCPAASRNTTHGEGVGAASATRSASRTSASPRASTTTPPPGCGWRCIGGEPVATVHTAAAEVGQGLVTVQAQIARTELGVERGRRRAGRHRGRLGRLDVGVAPDVR